jgi:tripartite-type tricarboxylate transporter receptor subunit TctC
MNFARRQFLRAAAAIAAMPAPPRFACAQSYPARPVRILVGLPAGGAPDMFARLVAGWLSDHFGQPFVVDNRPGASGNIATELLVRAAPDGYTLLMVIAPNVINPALYPDLKFNFIRDTTPVAGIGGSPFVMVVNPAIEARTVPEFIAYAKAHPGKLNIGSTGVGNLTHMAAELFKMMAGVDLLHVPYRGEAAVQADLLGGRVQVMFDPVPAALGYIRGGRLRALAVTADKPMELLPGVPAMTHYLPGYEVTGMTGIVGPRGLSPAVVATLNTAINACLADAGIAARFKQTGSVTMAESPADFGNFLVAETAKWARVIKFAGIKAE